MHYQQKPGAKSLTENEETRLPLVVVHAMQGERVEEHLGRVDEVHTVLVLVLGRFGRIPLELLAIQFIQRVHGSTGAYVPSRQLVR